MTLLMCTRSRYLAFISTVAVTSASVFAQPVAAPSFQRLPPVTFPLVQFERLPSTDDAPPADRPQAESSGIVHFAGGAVELRLPPGWWAKEVPFGREIRLVITPQRATNVRRMPVDSMWVVYHVAPLTENPGHAELSRALAERLQAAGESNRRYSPPTPFQFGPWPAAVAEFTAGDSDAANTPISGRHVVVRTQWGVFEFQASAPDAVAETRRQVWSEAWESLRLNPPAASSGAAEDGPAESSSMIGDWKSYRSRLRFRDDGRVVIVPDALDRNRSSKPLTGSFEARGDLIFIHWDDGSRLNLRWRLQENDLFLTDHEGQISHLKRVFD